MCRYPSNNMYTVVEEWIQGYFCLGCFSSLTNFHLVKKLAREVWLQCVLVFGPLAIFGLLAGFCTVTRRTQGRSPFPTTKQTLRGVTLHGSTFSVSTITDGNARAGSRRPYLPLRWPDCTLSRLRAEEYDRPVTQPVATPEPSSKTIPTPDQALVACQIHPGADGPVQGELPPISPRC